MSARKRVCVCVKQILDHSETVKTKLYNEVLQQNFIKETDRRTLRIIITIAVRKKRKKEKTNSNSNSTLHYVH